MMEWLNQPVSNITVVCCSAVLLIAVYALLGGLLHNTALIIKEIQWLRDKVEYSQGDKLGHISSYTENTHWVLKSIEDYLERRFGKPGISASEEFNLRMDEFQRQAADRGKEV